MHTLERAIIPESTTILNDSPRALRSQWHEDHARLDDTVRALLMWQCTTGEPLNLPRHLLYIPKSSRTL